MERAYPLAYITAGTPRESSIKPRSSSDLQDWHFIPLQMAAWATGLQLLPGQQKRDLERTLAWEMKGQRGTLPCPQQHTRVCKFPLGGVDTKKVAGLEPSPLQLVKRVSPMSVPAAATEGAGTEAGSGEEVAQEAALHTGKWGATDSQMEFQRTGSHKPREPQLRAPAPERTSCKSAGDTATTRVERTETSSWTAK